MSGRLGSCPNLSLNTQKATTESPARAESLLADGVTDADGETDGDDVTDDGVFVGEDVVGASDSDDPQAAQVSARSTPEARNLWAGLVFIISSSLLEGIGHELVEVGARVLERGQELLGLWLEVALELLGDGKQSFDGLGLGSRVA